MAEFKFLHAADIHLDSPLRGLETYPDAPVEQIRGATRRAMDNLVDLAIDQEVDFVLLAGDISDADWKDYNTSLFFAQRMGRLREAGIRVFVVSGNHDAASTITKALQSPDNVYFFSTKQPESVRLEDLGVAIHGQGYKTKDTREDLASSFPQAEPGLFNIGLLHTALTGRSGHEPYAPTSLDILVSKGYQYWALGHVHQREIVSREPWIVFPGNIQGRHIREEGAKGCSLVRVEERLVKDLEHHDLDVMRWHQMQLDITDCDCQECLWQEIRRNLESIKDQNQDRPVAIRLELFGQTPLHSWLHRNGIHAREECKAMAAGLGEIWLEKVSFTTKPEIDPEETFDQSSPLASLVRSIRELDLSSSFIQQIPELADLTSKLPSEILDQEEGFNLNNPEFLKKLQDEVRESLLGRLLDQGSSR